MGFLKGGERAQGEECLKRKPDNLFKKGSDLASKSTFCFLLPPAKLHSGMALGFARLLVFPRRANGSSAVHREAGKHFL